MPPTFESNRSANQFTARLLLHHLLDKETLQWLSSYVIYSLNDEQRLSLVFVREVGAIDNITYRQLNSDINNQRASYDLHYMCTKGLLEQKGQSRSTYYIAGKNFISSRLDGENSRANGEMCRAEDLPKELKKRVGETGKRMVAKDMESLIIDLCAYKPLSLAEMASLLQRDMRALRYHYINTLIKQKRLFYTIPEMLNHPNQKYTAVKNK